MSAAALHLYQRLTEATDDRTRAQIIAEAFSELEDRYPQLKEVATQPQLRETELRLQKEIREVELRLQKEIEKIRGEIKGVELKIADTRADLIRWVVGVGLLQSTLMTGVLLKVAHLI
jgi:hypothetical protein